MRFIYPPCTRSVRGSIASRLEKVYAKVNIYLLNLFLRKRVRTAYFSTILKVIFAIARQRTGLAKPAKIFPLRCQSCRPYSLLTQSATSSATCAIVSAKSSNSCSLFVACARAARGQGARLGVDGCHRAADVERCGLAGG